MRLIHSLAYHPQTDGQAERVNQILEDMLRAFMLNYPDNRTSVCRWLSSLVASIIRRVSEWHPLKLCMAVAVVHL
jgi:hypothetical protein